MPAKKAAGARMNQSIVMSVVLLKKK